MRCPDCNKFVSFDEPAIEILDEAVDNEGTVTGEAQITLACAECGLGLSSTTIPFEVQIDHKCKEKESEGEPKEEVLVGETGAPEEEGEEEEEFEVEMDDPEPTEDFKPKTTKQGKPVSPRYQKHYGATISGKVICQKCWEEIPFEVSVEEQASAFDSLV